MVSSISNLVNSLSEGIHKIKCKYRHNGKKCETCGIKYKYCDYFLECADFKNDLIEHKCLCNNKSYQRKFDQHLEERFFNPYKFSNHGNNKFIFFIVAKRCLSVWISGWLGKAQWDTLAWKRRFLWSLKYGHTADAD